MDEITREDVSPQIEGELTLPSPPKRPKTDCTMTNNHSGKIRFDFPELFTFRQTIGSPSSASTLQESAGQVGIAECGDIEDEKPHEQQEDTQLVVTAITRLTTSHTEDAHTGSSKVGMIAGERCFNPLVRDEQPPVTETDKLSSYPADDAGGAIAESHTSKDPSSHPDCKSLGKSLEDEAPGGCSLHAGNDKDWRQVRNRLSPIQKFTLSSSDEGVRCQSDCSYEDALRDTGFCKTLSQSADVEESNLKRDEHGFSENILFSKEGEEGNRHISFSEYADCESIYPAPEDQPSENLAERVQYEEKILELQICGNGNVAMCDGGTKGQIYENGMSKNSIPFAAEYAERSIVSNDVVLARNITIESVSIEAEYFCGEREHAGNMIAKAWSETADHTTETPMPARISQEPAEGNNDASPFSVFDPAIWSETDRKAEEKPCNSESTAGVKLFPSVKVCVMETPLSLCFDARLSQEVSAPTHTGQCEDEKDDLWQSYTEPKACTITTNRTHKTDNKGTCVWKSSPSSTPCRPAKPHAKDEKQESNDTLRHQLKEQDPSGSSPVGPDHLKTQEVEYLQTEKQEREGMTRFKEELRTDEHVKSDNSSGLEEKLLQQHEKHIEELSEMLTDDCFSNWTEEIISTYGNNLTHINKELGNWKNIECLLDHPYSVTVSTMEGTTEEKDRKEEARVGEETDVHGNSEIVVKSDDHPQQQSQQNGDMTEQCISECADGNMSKSSHKLTLVSQHEQENKLRCFSDTKHRAETFMVEHKEDILAFTSPPTSDAVVPGPHELPHSQNADNPTAPNCNNTFSPVPSGYTFNSRVPGGFDTFEKIQLSLDDDDDDASLSNSLVLSSEAGQLYQFMPESNKHLEVPEEEEEEEEEKEMEIFECQTDNMAKGLTCSDTSCKDLTNFISAADVMALGSPEQQPNCESSYSSSECFHDDFNPQPMSSPVLPKSNSLASDVNDSPKFEMEKQFDMVLKELNLFFDISISDLASDSRAPSPEQSDDVTGVLEGDTSNCKEHLSSPELGPHRDTSSNGADEDCSLELCGGDPVVSCSSGSGDGEQEVPLGSHPCQETSMYTAEKHIEPQEMEQKRKMWSPSFECQPFLEQLSHRQPEQPRRLEPLKTCSRPIRVGLSKRAKTKHLHHLHAYK
ncbi:uncharacterized protein LOC116706167 [Etheostoma spectabile]|uniref:RAD51 interacting motif domain-containing protein n=1 Tax=Etheostoma spectabile TaxID=54343 RepID=A0A5J5CMY5_9PERO|nr:uncharacterized protein LOC116706167 [Etheostoma spectabile]KAA8583292.1 hypothetical protein FQN60_015838 [Etheostoma spectabile]